MSVNLQKKTQCANLEKNNSLKKTDLEIWDFEWMQN